MQKRGIVHPKLMAKLATRFFPSCCTIQKRTEVQSESGFADYTWNDLPGHVNLSCRIAPATSGERARGQVNLSSEDYEKRTYDVALAGRYDSIDAAMRVQSDDGQFYDIVRIDHDDQGGMTVLRCKQVE